MERLNDLVIRTRAGDLEAYGRVVQATQAMAYAAAAAVLRDPGLAEDAVQEASLRAFRRLDDSMSQPHSSAGCGASWLPSH